jgi:hypothetical protein
VAYMKDKTGRRLDSFEVVDTRLRRRDVPSYSAYKVMATPPTYTAGAADAASAITSSFKIEPENRGAFTFLGGAPVRLASLNNNVGINTNSYLGTAPFWSVEFHTDAPKIEIIQGGAGSSGRYRLIVDGQKTQADAIPARNSTSRFYDLYDWAGVRKMRHYRIEADTTFRFGGVNITKIDTIVRAADERPTIIMGDSFTEPSVRDNSADPFVHDGWPGVFGRALGLRNCTPRGSGGTGYLNPGTAPRVKFRDRFMQDVVAFNPVRLFFAGGINDANREPTYTPQMAHDEALILFNMAKTELPNAEIAVFSPWCSRGSNASLWSFSAAIQAAATEAGLPFYDLLGMTRDEDRISTTLAAPITAPTTSISLTGAVPIGSVLRIGNTYSGSTTTFMQNAQVTAITGTGPYTVNLLSTFNGTAPIGATVVTSGNPWTYGDGRQGATTDNGPSDLTISDDTTHPTVLGHESAGLAALQKYVAKMPY